LFRPALARRRWAIVWSLQYFATQVQVRIPLKPGLGQGFRPARNAFDLMRGSN